MHPRRMLLASVTLLLLIGAIYDVRLSLSYSVISNEFKAKPQGDRSESSPHEKITTGSSSVDASTDMNVPSRLNLTTRVKASSIRHSFQTNGTDTTANNNALLFSVSAPETAVTTIPSANNINGAVTETSTQPATIVVQLSGEMGNQLSKIAHGHALFLWLKREFRLDATVVLRHQTHPKWVGGRDNVQNCFPATRSYDFSGANTLEFENRSRQQSAWLGSSLDAINNPESAANVSSALQLFAQLNRSEMHEQHSMSNSNISLPFLYADLLVSNDLFMDRFYDDFRELFRFDSACCHHRPEPDESVFHFRNYLKEMPRKGRRKGYEELSPNQTARQLFGHLGRGDKVAMTTRFDNAALPYVEALERRGIQVRVVSNQTDTQDFCFLMQAQKEIVGLARSTFFLWAGFLGNCSRVCAYSVDSPDRREAVPNVFDHYNWTHPELQSRVFFELYRVDPLERRYFL